MGLWVGMMGRVCKSVGLQADSMSVRRDSGALSTSSSQAKMAPATDLAPAWKKEVNQRLAAHKSRKSGSTPEPEVAADTQHGASKRAEQAAARVAARYAKAPSYSEMLAEEARAAVRAAESASRAALEAQAAAESVLAGLEAGLEAEQSWEPEAFHGGAGDRALELAWKAPEGAIEAPETYSNQKSEKQTFGIRWDTDLPARSAEPVAARAPRGPEAFGLPLEGWWEPEVRARGGEGIEPVEPAQPMHANLIEFPREIVATRKVRPRLAEGRCAAAGEPIGQLSIFEVDPGSISTEPEAANAVTEAAAPSWQEPVWSRIQLDAQPRADAAHEVAMAAPAPALQLAPLGWRAMAAVVDGALILGVFTMCALVAVVQMKAIPSMRAMELMSVAGLMVIGALYQWLFFALGEGTPGMKYASLSLCTFEDQNPIRAQLRSRLVALLLSVLPLGLGVAWAIFDEEHLSWHDRLSGTYQRRG
jgi:uncharacterized RDD family membrane protein YckC